MFLIVLPNNTTSLTVLSIVVFSKQVIDDSIVKFPFIWRLQQPLTFIETALFGLL